MFIPREVPVGKGHTGFRTSDGDVYVRHTASGVIRRVNPKVRGKAARKAEKAARCSARAQGAAES